MRRRDVLRVGGLAVASALAGCSGGPSDERTVDMTDGLDFDPKSATVAEGGTVTWRNVGTVRHTVTAYEGQIPSEATYFASGGFESEQRARTRLSEGLIGASETYEHTFREPGTYAYVCLPHESSGMVGTINVT